MKREIGAHNRRALAATEVALLLPLLMIIVLGAIDFGRFAHTHIAVTNAARAGAGYGIMHPYTGATQTQWQADVRTAVLDEMAHVVTNSSFTNTDVTVTTSRTVESDGLQRISVEVTFPYTTIVTWPTIPNSITLNRTVVMRVIR